MNIPVHLGHSMLELSEILVFEFSQDNVKPKYSEKAKLYYTDTNIKILVCIKTNVIYEINAEDVESGFNNSNYELDRPLPKIKKLLD